jgi:hypothetical protein
MVPEMLTGNAWAALAIGGPLNVLLLWLVHKHTSTEMRPYGRILVQSSVTCLAMLLLTAIQIPVGRVFYNIF